MNKNINNAKWLVVQNIISSIVSILTTAIVSRYLGPELYGKINYIASLITIFSSISTFGIDSILTVEIVKKREDEGKIVASAIFIKCILSVVSYLAMIVIISTTNSDRVLLEMAFFQGLSIFFSLSTILGEWFLTNLISKYYVLASIISLVMCAVLKLFGVLREMPVTFFAIAITFEGCLTCFCCLLFMLKIKCFTLKIDIAIIKEILKKSIYFVISNMAIIIYTQIDKVLINNLKTSYDLGIYSAASTIANMWLFLPAAYINSYKADILVLWEQDKENAKLKLKKIITIVMSFCSCLFLLISIFSKIVLCVLYGSAYKEGYISLIILVGASVFSIYGTIGSIWILGEKVNKYSTYRTVIGAIANLMIDFILIPKYGINGAALGTLISQSIAAFFCMFVWKETREFNLLVWKR